MRHNPGSQTLGDTSPRLRHIQRMASRYPSNTSSARRAGTSQKSLAYEPGPVQRQFDFDQVTIPESSSVAVVPEDRLARFALRFAAALEADSAARFDNPAISKLAREIFGASAGHARETYDAAEAGFNIYLNRVGLNLSNTPAALDRLLTENNRLPLQTTRDHNQVEWQQFSTPHAEALLVVKAAGLQSGMQILEPSAGTGNIAALARLAGAHVDTNEIDPRRRQLLTLQGFQPLAWDAERLDNLLSAEQTYHAVVMNPPFSATGGRVRGHQTAFGARHLEQALLRIKPGGRLVAIVGGGMAMDRPAFSQWWAEIGSQYRIRANVGLDGREYSRFGTMFDHQIVVIDRAGRTTDPASIVTASKLSVLAAWDVLQRFSREDVYGQVCEFDAAARSRGDAADISAGGDTGDRSLGGTRRPVARGRSGRTGRSQPVEFEHAPVVDLERAGLNAAKNSIAGDNASSSARTAGTSCRTGGHAELGGDAGADDARLVGNAVGELDRSRSPQAAEIREGAVFASYRVQKAVVHGAHSHPANVVESAMMACVEPPDVTYRHQLPADVIAEGRISNLQIEDVIYAGQASNSFLPDGSRKGHWNGDGTGIGKGREIYAFMLDQVQQGKRKHVHISASHQLCADAQRDCSAVGVPLKILHQSLVKPHEPMVAEAGIFFTTYTMLSTDFAGERERFKQLTDWLGTDFDGVIAFDEAHLMKNAAATPHGAKATVDQGTLRGNMGITLQRLFPQARVRYFSATGATEARHLAPYERLGLWGVGAPFADFPAFLVAMQRGGVAAMEMLCRDLKSVGTYLSRTISYGPTRLPDGSTLPQSGVEYEPLLHRLSAAERHQYDQIANLWSELLLAFESAEQGAGQSRNGHRYSQFYSAQQRFFLQLMLAYTLPDVIPAIAADLQQGRSVVLSLFNTGEAQSDRKVRQARAEGAEISELDATPREMIVQLIETQFPLYQYREQTDPVTGNVVRVRVEDAAGNPEINRQNQRQQQELLEKVADLDFPQNPLDALITRFGVKNVAEISGRTHRFENGRYVRRKLDGIPRRTLNEHETRLFQQGEKRLAILSGAGSVGISVHADLQAKNQERRVFYAFQLSWSADQQMQAFGRVHRSHQSSAPIIRLVLVDLAGQKRLVNAVSKRLAALGALTKGERQSLGNDLFRPEDVTDEYGQAALCRLYREIEQGKHRESGFGLPVLDRMGVLNKEKTAVRESYASNVEQFLNRIMVLPVELQNEVFELFYERYLQAVESAKSQGAFDFGVEEIRANNLRQAAQPETLFIDPASGARTLLHELEGVIDVVRHPFASVAKSSDLGFYRNVRSSRIYGVAAHRDPQQSQAFLTAIKGPRRSLERHELAEKYEPVEHELAQAWWDAEYANTPETESRPFHLLSGAIFPIYDKIMGASGIQNVKIARAVLADGQALVGLNLSPTDVPQVKQRLGIGTPLASAAPTEILGLVTSGSVIELDNGWRLTTGRVAGDDVVELILNGIPAHRDELLGYGLAEEIFHYKRRWFVTVDDASAVLPRLLQRRKAIRDLTSADTIEECEVE